MSSCHAQRQVCASPAASLWRGMPGRCAGLLLLRGLCQGAALNESLFEEQQSCQESIQPLFQEFQWQRIHWSL